jgi:mannose-6-phosphate isomerase
MTALYPLRFQPILRRYLWGGRRLATLNKSLGPDNDYAESWEVVDRQTDQSVVLAGPLAGETLGNLVRKHGQELLGRHAPANRFPLLFKFLDANDRLSIQVHPDDAAAAKLDPPDLGKTEAWVVLDADPQRSFLFAGLRAGTTREILQGELQRRVVELSCHRVVPHVGDCYFLPAGVVHAIGPGLLIAEIQQASDTTYRLYDFDRRGPDGLPRKLHVDEALAVIDFDYGPVAAQVPQPTDKPGTQNLVRCDKFILDRTEASGSQLVGGDGTCHILAVIDGQATLAGDPLGRPLVRGDVVLLPAALGPVELQAPQGATFLDAYLP